ncbi:uncharacterized protein LOC126845248 [Adelges cooleyi]|uniref:uncharacterized protein LOC126845248 n=1 Tax=Adelges cooleyi TaxID=133065 RepID=UPI00217FE6F8|nr:uncharacterized protein LOC126845248 [Adelges cooleyi]
MFLRNTTTVLYISGLLAQMAFTDPTQVADPLAQLFNVYDQNHDGAIVAQELKEVLTLMELDLTDNQVEARLREYSPNGDGQMRLADFRNMMSHPVDNEEKTKVLQNMSGGHNFISVENLQTILENIHFEFNPAELRAIDVNGDSKITIEEIDKFNCIPIVVE